MTKPLLKSEFVYWPNAAQRAEMRDWCDDIECAWQPGLLLNHASQMNNLEIEASIRNHVWKNLWWTGNQDPRAVEAGLVDSPLDLLRSQAEHSLENGGRGPTWSCGPLAATYVGLLAVFDIPARRVWCSRGSDGQEDNGAEFWTGENWVLVVPHLNLHFDGYCRRLSAYQFCVRERNKGRITPITITGQGVPFYGDDPVNLNRWAGMSARMAIMRGNMPFAQTGTLRPKHWEHLEIMAPTGNAKDMPLLVRSGTFDPRSLTDAP